MYRKIFTVSFPTLYEFGDRKDSEVQAKREREREQDGFLLCVIGKKIEVFNEKEEKEK